MFRRKENEPVRPPGAGETLTETSFGRSPSEVKPPQPELPRRQVDLPTAHGAPADKAEAKPEVAETKRLIVGHGISLSGEITACDRLIVQGSVQVTLNQTKAIEISEAGRFTNGKAEVEEAEISGLYEGELTVRKRLVIRSSGQVRGTVRYGEIEIETGGKLSGSVSMLTDTK